MSSDVLEVPLLNFNNYEIHPVEKNYMVFFFSEQDAADCFEKLLKDNNIFFEKDVTDDHRKKYLFGIKRRNFKKVSKLNDLTLGRHRERTIAHKTGLIILIVTSLLILLSVISFFVTK